MLSEGMGWKSTVILQEDTAFGNGVQEFIAEIMEAEAGIKVIDTIVYDTQTLDFAPIFNKAVGLNPDFMYLISSVNSPVPSSQYVKLQVPLPMTGINVAAFGLDFWDDTGGAGRGTSTLSPIPAVGMELDPTSAVSWVLLGGLLFFVHRTRLGRAIQAVSMDRKGALIAGIEAHRMNVLTWMISGALGAVAGVFFATYTQLRPGMWVGPLIIAVAVVVIGGIGSIIGSRVVAHLIGFMETITTTMIAAELRGVFTMLLIIVVLTVAPQGLFGRREI